MKKYVDEIPLGTICCSGGLFDYQRSDWPDLDLMTKLDGSRAKEMRAIWGQGEAVAQDSGRREGDCFWSFIERAGLTDKHWHASFQQKAGYHHVVKHKSRRHATD